MKKILVIDDFAYIQLLFKRSLGKEGFEVTAAKTAAEAAEHLGLATFDLIVLDINLPDMSGLDLLRKMREQGVESRVLVVSAFAGPDMMGTVADLDVSGIFSKPVVLNDFIGKVKEVLLGKSPSDSKSLPKLLVVDDQEQVCNLMDRTFSKEGFQVVGVGDGYEALTYIKHEEFKGVIIDLTLPGMDGLTLIEKIREIRGEMPIIVITAYPSKEAIIKCKQLNVADIFAKPLKIAEFKARVRTVFG